MFRIITNSGGNGRVVILVPMLILFWCGGLKLEAWTLTGAALIGQLITLVVKYSVNRPRPNVIEDLVLPTDPSFSSGHALGSAVLYGWLGVWLWRQGYRKSAALMVIWALLVGFSRVYFGVHHPSDVLASLTLAIPWLTIVFIFYDRQKKETAMTKVLIIINPASGVKRPILKILNNAFGKTVEWDIAITHKYGDAHRHAENALAAGVDIVAAYGGDGTVTEVANVLAEAGGQTPLAILPGGTGNGVARMINIPMELEQSAALLMENYQLRAIDLGRINDHTFMLRADIGFMAVTGAETPRMVKDRFGKWAYAISSVQHRALLNPIPYHMTLDGEEMEVQGVMCMIINTGAVAFGHRPLARGIAPDDGLQDVLVLTRNDLVALGEVASSAFLGNPTPMQHWQVKTAVIHTDPPQAMSVDGELIEKSPAHIQILPQAVKVIVPAAAAPAA